MLLALQTDRVEVLTYHVEMQLPAKGGKNCLGANIHNLPNMNDGLLHGGQSMVSGSKGKRRLLFLKTVAEKKKKNIICGQLMRGKI